ncbi:hypothetical protein BDW74DRAFT_172613 [Aspergillus multicolor]|uniref:uncharacterized protein n=1 Tax=Aspergillus multicolor TaxID=41759 RepID=UPI003CCDF0A9
MNAQSKIPTAAEHSHVDMDAGAGIKFGALGGASDEDEDREEDENPHLPPLTQYLKMTEERKNV